MAVRSRYAEDELAAAVDAGVRQYVVLGAGLAECGNHVVCGDIDAAKIAMLNAGGIPIFEPGLDDLVGRNRTKGRLSFTTDIPEIVRESTVVFIAVGTPPSEDGSADLDHVLACARTIAQHMDGYRLIVVKSTVPVGTCARVRAEVAGRTSHRSTSPATRSS